MVTKIIACADIHVPSVKGIDELKSQMKRFIDKCKKIIKEEDNASNVRIVVCGDVFHQKIAITSESILCVDWFFKELDKLCKTYIVVGNHDMLMNNLDRVDAITPLFEIGKYNQVSYIDKDLDYKSGIIVDDNVAWCLFSSFDSFNTPDIMVHKEANKSKNLTYVGLIHGDVNGAITTTNYVTDNGLDPKVFDGCDFVIAGHIHKRQEIKKNGIPIVYCSSLKQQNFGESVSGHGFVLWDIEDKDEITYKNVDIKDKDGGYFKFEINNIDDINEDKEELINY